MSGFVPDDFVVPREREAPELTVTLDASGDGLADLPAAPRPSSSPCRPPAPPPVFPQLNKVRARRGGLAAAAVPLAVGLLAGCAAALAQAPGGGHAASHATGRVTGHLIMEGGAIQPGQQQPPVRPIPGTVTFTATGHRQTSVRVGTSGTFSVRLAPGKYQVSAKSPRIIEVNGGRDVELPCSQPVSVTVGAGHAAAITVACIVP
jgi:hypothetical protein